MMELSPELIQLLLSSGQRDQQEQQLKRQQGIADKMRSPDAGGGGGHMAGRVFVPQTLANVAAGAYSNYKGSQMQPGIDKGMSGLATSRDEAKRQYAQALIQALRNQRPPQQPGMEQQPQMFNPQAGP